MKKLYSALLFCLIPAVCFAQTPKAHYQEFLEKSIFPLQDQTRYFGKSISAPESGCHTESGVTGIYNLRENNGILEFDCFGNYNVSCGAACFHDGAFLGKYVPEIECAGEVDNIGSTDGEDFVLEKQTCKDNRGRLIWERGLNDDYVFDTLGNLIFYKDKNSTSFFRGNSLQRRLYASENEIEYYDKDDLKAFFHVIYELNANGRIIRETHLNKDGYPYYIYNAEYINNKCTKITRTDTYNHKVETFEFE